MLSTKTTLQIFTGQNYCLLFGVVFLSKVQCNILLKFASSKYKKGKNMFQILVKK